MSYPQAPYPPATHGFDPVEYQRRQDASQLHLLAVFHYVMGALSAVSALIPLVYVGFGVMMRNLPPNPRSNPDPFPQTMMGDMFITIGLSAAAVCVALAVFTILAGRDLSMRRGSTLIQVMACINCLHVPIGTALGVFTLIVMGRPSVQALFRAPKGSATGIGGSVIPDDVPEIDRPAYESEGA